MYVLLNAFTAVPLVSVCLTVSEGWVLKLLKGL